MLANRHRCIVESPNTPSTKLHLYEICNDRMINWWVLLQIMTKRSFVIKNGLKLIIFWRGSCADRKSQILRKLLWMAIIMSTSSKWHFLNQKFIVHTLHGEQLVEMNILKSQNRNWGLKIFRDLNFHQSLMNFLLCFWNIVRGICNVSEEFC